MRRATTLSSLRLLGCLVPLAVYGAPAVASAAVAWTATFETGDLSEWKPGINNTKGDRKNVEVLGEQVYRGQYAGKIVVHPDDTFTFGQNRVDIQHPSTLTDEGEDSYLSGHYMMPDDAKVRNQIGFYESNVSFQNVMDIWVEPKAGGGTSIVFGTGFLGETKQWTGDFTKGAWHQVAIHVHWSQNQAMGSVDLWFDGVKVVNGVKAKTKADGNTLFYQTGLHRKDTSDNTDTIYIDDFIEADTEAEAKIAAPTPANAAGGSGGGGGSSAGGSSAGGAATGGGAVGGSAAAGMPAVAAGASSVVPGGGAGGSASGGAPSAAGGSLPGAAGSASPAAAATQESSGCSLTARPSRLAASGLLGLLGLAALTAWRRRSR